MQGRLALSFYQDPSFFVLLLAALVPAAFLGCLGRSLRGYGLVVSLAFLAMLFSYEPEGLAIAGCYVLACWLATRSVLLAMWRPLPIARIATTDGGASQAAADATGAVPAEASPRTAPLPLRALALVCCLGPLVIYKLTLAAGAGMLGFMGISYITFKACQVLLEVEDGLVAELPFLDYLYFLAFFPTFTSGPIDRSRRFLADAHGRRSRASYLDLLSRGLVMLCVGFLMQGVLATVARQWYKPVALDPAADIPSQLLGFVSSAWAYAAYLYLDFAGYSLMARGAGMGLGIEVPANFRLPFLSCSMAEFWDRWNITLSHWLRDYVFMRVERALARRRWPKGRDNRASLGLVANMMLMGAWHGLAPQYLIYGAYHGILLAFEARLHRHWKFWRKHQHDLPVRLVGWAVTMHLVVLGLSIFSGQLLTFLGGIHV